VRLLSPPPLSSPLKGEETIGKLSPIKGEETRRNNPCLKKEETRKTKNFLLWSF